MSIPSNRCIRVVIPDDHVGTNGFHEVLIRDMDEADPPFVMLGELGCLYLDWPRVIFSFMGRYQVDLEHLRHECGSVSAAPSLDCVCTVESLFGRIWAGSAPVFTWILPSFGGVWCPGVLCGGACRRIALTTCTRLILYRPQLKQLIWHDGSLRGRFPGNNVTLLRSSVSGVAMDVLLFSRIGVLLIHRYCVFSHVSTHVAFRGTYVTKLRNFLGFADAA